MIECDLLDMLPSCIDPNKDYNIKEILLLLPRNLLAKLSQTKINQQELITHYNIATIIDKLLMEKENAKRKAPAIHVEMVFWRDDGFDCYDSNIFDVESKDPSKIDNDNQLYTKFRFIDFENGERNIDPYIYFGKRISYDDAISMIESKSCSCVTPLFFKRPDRIIIKPANNGVLYLSSMDEDDAMTIDEAIELYKSQESKSEPSKIKTKKLV